MRVQEEQFGRMETETHLFEVILSNFQHIEKTISHRQTLQELKFNQLAG